MNHVAFDRVDKLGALWCTIMHDSPMWPIHNEYQCRTCGRHYSVPWATPKIAETRLAETKIPGTKISGTKIVGTLRAVAPLVIAAAILSIAPLRAADAPLVESPAPAALAFARYISNLEDAGPWNLETIEIDAALPKSEKKARLRAIRRALPFGKHDYQVLEFAGDATVRHQVIGRYLSAQQQAETMPADTVAITPANYKFRYKGPVEVGESMAYAFQITPRHKREGLIKGELWIDSDTGAALRQSGYLVKKPSIFVKRIEVTRETALRDGLAQLRTTHISVDTRLVGRAELTIEERPYAPAPSVGPATSVAESR